MIIKSFKQWFLEENTVPNECNCWLSEMFMDMLTSNDEEKIKEFREYTEQYFAYVSTLTFEMYN